MLHSPADEVSGGRPQHGTWAADAAILLCIATALRGPTFGLSEINWDESAFALVAREILHGHWPFTTLFDHKPIGLYLHYAAALAFFGDNPVAVRLLGLFAAVATAALVRFGALHRLGLSRPWGLLLGASYLCADIGFGGQAVYSEHLVNFYALASALLLGDRRPLRIGLSGFFAGVAISVNYLALPVIAGLIAGHVVGLLRSGRDKAAWLSLALWFAAGLVLATALLLSPILLFSDPSAYFAPQLHFIIGYSASNSLEARLTDFADVAALFLPLALAAAVLAWLERGRPTSESYYPWLFTGMALGSALAALASGYVFEHYFLLLLPPMLLLLPSFGSAIANPAIQAVSAAVVAGTALMIGVPGLVVTAIGARDLMLKLRSNDVRDDIPRQLARAIRLKAADGSTIYSFCAPLVLYQLLHSEPPTKYPFYPHNLNPAYASALGLDVDAQIAAIFDKRPAIVVMGSFDKCWNIPFSSWRKVRDRLRQDDYAPYYHFDGYWVFAPATQVRAAETR